MQKSSAVLFAVSLALASGCTVYRDLRITEVGFREVELYLDEPADHQLALQDYTLRCASSNGETNSLPLFGMLDGGDFIVVWEDPNHTDVPEAAEYLNFDNQYVPGIKVPAGFFGTQTNTLSYAYRVHGKHRRGNITDKVDDVVKFGPTPRPSIGGAFAETSDMTNATRTVKVSYMKGQTVTRKWPSSGIIETDSESDWKMRNETFGEPNR